MKAQLFDVKLIFFLAAIFSMVLANATFAKPAILVDNLKCEYKENPVGIDIVNPRLSWQLMSDNRGTIQSAYEIRVARTLKDLESEKKSIWATPIWFTLCRKAAQNGVWSGKPSSCPWWATPIT